MSKKGKKHQDQAAAGAAQSAPGGGGEVALAAPAAADEPKGSDKLSDKAYDHELKKLHVELVKLQEWVVAQGPQGLHRLRGARRRRQGRHHQGDHRARQPARVPRRRAAGADRAREEPDVRAALHAALPGRRRGRDLRPQLVQPRRRRAGDGVLHRGAGASASSKGAAGREGDDRIGHHPAQVLARSQPGRTDAAARARIDDGRKIWKLSPMDLKSYTRWYDYSRARDEMFAATDTPWAPWYVVPIGRQEAGAAQHHHAHPRADRAVRGHPKARQDQAARAPDRPHPDDRLPVPLRDRALLNAPVPAGTAAATGALRLDVVAGLTAAAVVLPKAMAYATVAGLPVGRWACTPPSCRCWCMRCLGSSRVLERQLHHDAWPSWHGDAAGNLVVPDGDPGRLLTAAAATLAALAGAHAARWPRLLQAGLRRQLHLARRCSPASRPASGW